MAKLAKFAQLNQSEFDVLKASIIANVDARLAPVTAACTAATALETKLRNKQSEFDASAKKA